MCKIRNTLVTVLYTLCNTSEACIADGFWVAKLGEVKPSNISLFYQILLRETDLRQIFWNDIIIRTLFPAWLKFSTNTCWCNLSCRICLPRQSPPEKRLYRSVIRGNNFELETNIRPVFCSSSCAVNDPRTGAGYTPF